MSCRSDGFVLSVPDSILFDNNEMYTIGAALNKKNQRLFFSEYCQFNADQAIVLDTPPLVPLTTPLPVATYPAFMVALEMTSAY